jgi:hypothetical protein
MLHFHKVEDVFKQAEPAIEMLKTQILQVKEEVQQAALPGN